MEEKNSEKKERKMRDSGIPWIGEVPEGWGVNKIKYHLTRNEIKNKPDKQVLSVYRDYGVIPKDSRDDNHNVTSEDTSKYKYVQKGDLVINKMKAWQGSLGVSKYEGIVSPAYYIYKFHDDSFDGKFFHYLIRGCYKDEFRRISGGIREGQWDLSAEKFENTMIIIPSIPEQHRIADFLDSKCSEIDTLIENLRARMESAKEYKKAVITETVTKGLDKDAKMKDSGVEWIGEIPEKWKLVPFKYLLNERNEKNYPIKSDERLSLSIDKGITLYSEKTTNLDRFKDDVGQYKLAYCGDFVMNSMNMIVGAVGVSKYFGCVSPAYYVFFDDEPDNCYCKYCDYLFHTSTLKRILFSLGKGIMAIDRGNGNVNTCRLKVSRYDLGALKLPIPPREELQSILSYLDSKCSEIDALLQNYEDQIATLEEYKKSLIYEYVTGKKEVPTA